jgi:hypothetical protein
MTISRTKLALLTLVAACAGQAAQAIAAPPGATVATLAVAPPVPVHRVIDGRAWDCADMTCTASAAADAESQPVPRECNRAARELGAFAAYQTGSRALTAPELAKCNSGAKFLANG